MDAVVIMSRIPVPGKTKTRLEGFLTSKECADLHRAFLKDILTMRTDKNKFLSYGDEGPLELVENILPYDVETFPQRGENLGEKMKNVFIHLFSLGYENIVLFGADIPEITETDIENALKKLKKSDLVFGPTLDGGYYLVGMKKIHEIVFSDEIKWGSASVFEKTINLIKKKGIDVDLIDIQEDIDTKDDLINLYKRIKNTSVCKNTEKFVEGLGERIDGKTNR
ncbi:TIGR04282 family arsenosugar biosynthesis glycosyltransferase [Psychrilyobacter sp.]|uniref:TIGR04282 family arsenosugar biosynthesis glycosyltransferase n=1 Tax=Psychrilyobacter sp. TaxID=2586924 RepID=UPI003018B9B1